MEEYNRRKVIELFDAYASDWKPRAAEGIEKYRKGDAVVTVDEAALKSSGYLSYHSQLVTDMYKYSKYIFNQDYYRKVFPNG